MDLCVAYYSPGFDCLKMVLPFQSDFLLLNPFSLLGTLVLKSFLPIVITVINNDGIEYTNDTLMQMQLETGMSLL